MSQYKLLFCTKNVYAAATFNQKWVMGYIKSFGIFYLHNYLRMTLNFF